ncbi:MAG: hypothetical protein PF517_03665 [Salinivirgaceae bacterium]|jgi:hypothetical protein|nr:hypothetical protein [Salinivirgaceae bacterium]
MTKRIFSSIFLTFLALVTVGQNEYDVLNFSQFLPSGTARYTAMGGAFSALGADLSVMATNPAGTGLYRKGDFGVSTAWTDHNTTSDFNSAITKGDELSFQLTNLGFVMVNPNTTNSDWKSINVGFAYNHLNDYNKSYIISGTNNESSLLDFQTDLVNTYSDEAGGNAYFDAELIFLSDTINGIYSNDYSLNGEYGSDQKHKVRTSGYAGELDFNVSANYKDQLYLGATLGFQRINYTSFVHHSEEAYSNEIALIDFDSYDNLKAKGRGFNLKLGMLYKVSQMIRIGVAFHTPTLYNIKYDYWTDVIANLDLGNGIENISGISPKGSYTWQFSAPAKLILSSALVLSKSAIVSAEIEYMNYSSMNMSSTDDFFEEQNRNIEKIYSSAINIKTGAEYRIGMLSLRGGLGFIESPYNSSEPNADAYKLLASGGIGVNAGNVYFDASYQFVTGNEDYYMYPLNSNENSVLESSKANLTTDSHKFMATVGFRF